MTPAAANEKAQATIDRISLGLVLAAYAAKHATATRKPLDTHMRRVSEAPLSMILKYTSCEMAFAMA